MRIALVATVLLSVSACKKEDAKPAEVVAVPAPAPSKRDAKNQLIAQGNAEVEFFGELKFGAVKPASVVFVAQVEPCTPVPEKPTRFGEEKLKGEGAVFAEFFIPQGKTGHACVYGLDEAGKVVGAASSTQNPMKFEGSGEVVFARLEFTLAAP